MSEEESGTYLKVRQSIEKTTESTILCETCEDQGSGPNRVLNFTVVFFYFGLDEIRKSSLDELRRPPSSLTSEEEGERPRGGRVEPKDEEPPIRLPPPFFPTTQM